MATAPNSIPLKCEVVVPDPAAPLETIFSRWSNSRVQRPALVVIPGSEDDVVDAVRYAKERGLRFFVGGGGHNSYVPFDAKTLYLDMKKFNSVKLDKEGGTVQVGGGTLAGDVIRVCCGEGYCTTWPNSNAVGMVGCVLGGGNSGLLGRHGFMADNVVSFRLITAEGKLAEVGPSSSGEELALFNALCGAGHGLGVITSMTLKAFPMTSLGMDDGKTWGRQLIFPATAIRTAAELFVKLRQAAPNATPTFVCMRSRPESPAPGVPVILVAVACAGASEDGEKYAAPTFDPAVAGQAILARTVRTPLAQANDAFEFVNVHGDYKEIPSCFLKTLDADTIEAAFAKWLAFTDAHQGTDLTVIVLHCYNTEKPVALGEAPGGRGKFINFRDRGICVNAFTHYTDPATAGAMDEYQRGLIALFRQADSGEPITMSSNLLPWTLREHIYSQAQMAELDRVKGVWDGGNLFWRPFST